MPSRKTLLLGAGALALIAMVVVLVTGVGRGHPLKIERGDGSEFPLRGSLADDQGAIDDALDAWKDGRGGGADSRTRATDAVVHLLYAGRVGEVEVVLVRQGTRLIAMRQPLDRGWVVSDAREDFDPYDGSPVKIDGAVLLPTGDWTYLPLRGGGLRPLTSDGLISDGYAYGSLADPAFVVEGSQPADKVSKVYDSDAGLFSVRPDTLRRIMDASRRPGGLTAVHAALVQHDAEPRTLSGYRPLEVLWTGRLPGVRQAAVVALKDVHKLGLGLVSDPDAAVSRAESVSLGSLIGPLGARRGDELDPPYIGATYVGGTAVQPESLVAAATGSVDRIEFLVGKRRFSRPGPVAVVPVDWDAERTDAVVVGRTAGDAVIAPLVPQLP